MVAPAKEKGIEPPRLKIITSPYRRFLQPLLDYVQEVKKEKPDRLIAVVIPELVQTHWYEYLLHNQRATFLKVRLFLRGTNGSSSSTRPGTCKTSPQGKCGKLKR